MKRSHGTPYNARLRSMRARYSSRELEGYDLIWAVIHCFFRYGLTVRDTADVLNRSVEDIEYAISVAEQNAQ